MTVPSATWLIARLRCARRRHGNSSPRSSTTAGREIPEPMQIDGHTLPAATAVAAPSLLLHRDPEAFDEPDLFIADRFAEGVPDGAPYLPFGGGARRCIGEALAEAEFRTVLPTAL